MVCTALRKRTIPTVSSAWGPIAPQESLQDHSLPRESLIAALQYTGLPMLLGNESSFGMLSEHYGPH